MMAESVVAGISGCVDDLGLLLDQIYKFPQKQRQQYFTKIQGMKDKLLTLKANVRESNLPMTQKQYKQIYLAINSLKSEAMNKITLTSNKQNRDINRIRQSKRNYDEAMKLIVQKDDQIQQLSRMVFEKEQLININYQQLRQIKRQCQLLADEKDFMNSRINQLIINCQHLSITSRKSQEELLDLKIKNQEESCELRRAVEEIQNLKAQLTIAYDKLAQYEQLAQVSIKKTRLVEENIRRVESQAQNLNENYRLKETQNLKRLKEKNDLQAHLDSKQQIIQNLTNENVNFKKDIADLQKELVSMQTNIYDLRSLIDEQRQKHAYQIEKLQQESGYYQNEVRSLKGQLQETINKYEQILSKVNELQQQNEQKEEKKLQIQDKIGILQAEMENLMTQLQKKDQDLIFHTQGKTKLTDQLGKQRQKLQALVKQLQKCKEQSRSKDQQKYKIFHEIESYQYQIRMYQQDSVNRLETERQLQNALIEQKIKTTKLEQQYRQRHLQTEKLKIKLMRVKIETIHQIRETIIS